jgi:hypothetical protein
VLPFLNGSVPVGSELVQLSVQPVHRRVIAPSIRKVRLPDKLVPLLIHLGNRSVELREADLHLVRRLCLRRSSARNNRNKENNPAR